jgi:hypothetical protein
MPKFKISILDEKLTEYVIEADSEDVVIEETHVTCHHGGITGHLMPCYPSFLFSRKLKDRHQCYLKVTKFR